MLAKLLGIRYFGVLVRLAAAARERGEEVTVAGLAEDVVQYALDKGVNPRSIDIDKLIELINALMPLILAILPFLV